MKVGRKSSSARGAVSNIESRPTEGVTEPAPISLPKREAEHGDGRLFMQHQGQLPIGREPQVQVC